MNRIHSRKKPEEPKVVFKCPILLQPWGELSHSMAFLDCTHPLSHAGERDGKEHVSSRIPLSEDSLTEEPAAFVHLDLKKWEWSKAKQQHRLHSES